MSPSCFAFFFYIFLFHTRSRVFNVMCSNELFRYSSFPRAFCTCFSIFFFSPLSFSSLLHRFPFLSSSPETEEYKKKGPRVRAITRESWYVPKEHHRDQFHHVKVNAKKKFKVYFVYLFFFFLFVHHFFFFFCFSDSKE